MTGYVVSLFGRCKQWSDPEGLTTNEDNEDLSTNHDHVYNHGQLITRNTFENIEVVI